LVVFLEKDEWPKKVASAIQWLVAGDWRQRVIRDRCFVIRGRKIAGAAVAS
jgi:hypothetical protein